MRKTSAYARKRCHQADPSAIYRLMGILQPFKADELARLVTPVRAAFERMRTGVAMNYDFDTLAGAMNICLVRGESIDPLCVETAERAQDALMRALKRNKLIGKWGFDGPALQDITEGIDLYEQMLELSTPLQMKMAMQTTLNRMDKGELL